MMHSAVYEGRVRHRRFHPTANRFEYRLFLMYLDLSELDALMALHPLWSHARPNIAWFKRADHLGDPRAPLDHCVRELVARRTGKRPAGPIRLLTHLRYFGHCFNPVSFYYCFDQQDGKLETIVAEIHNTPWKEEHLYVLAGDGNLHPMEGWRRFRFAKAMHVSPFMPMELAYDWRFRVPGQRLNVHMIVNEPTGRSLLDATLDLRRREITHRRLSTVLLRYPLMTAKVTAMIHWQALRLYLKGTPVYTHPGKGVAPKEHSHD
jgi:uncharacterized protein